MDISNEDARVYAQNIVDSIRESLLILDHTMHVVSANKSFYRKFQVSPEEIENKLIYQLGKGQWNTFQLRHLLQTVIPEQKTFEDFKLKYRVNEKSEKILLLNARLIEREKGKPALILLAIEDVTPQYTARKKLKLSEAKYHKFVEEINSIIIGVNRNGSINFINHFSIKLFGLNYSEVIGKPFVGMIIPCIDSQGTDNSSICEELFLNPQKYYAYESEGVCKNGSRIWFSWSAKAVLDKNGNVSEILIDGNDVTELKATRREIEENSATLNSLLDVIPEGIMITDSSHLIRKVSHVMGELLGIPSQKLLNTTESSCADLLPLFWPDGHRITQPDELPLSKAAITGQQVLDYKLILKRDGVTRNLSANAAPICDSQGKVIGAIGGWRDITEQQTRMAEVLERKRVLDAIMDFIPVGIMLTDREGKITDVNKMLSGFLGIAEDKIIGIEEQPQAWGILEPSLRKPPLSHLMPLCRAIREGEVVNDEEYLLVCNGKERVVALSAAPVTDSNGDVAGGVALWQDITDRKRVEEILQHRTEELSATNRELESFSYSISHDLRGPLSVINGFVSVLSEDYGECLNEQGLACSV